ncbi:alpha/beta hydrolase [Undibacterium arcticum]|uniref:Alpha/beta hydrolase n=1 Tax=Undibacterium arcticum TaxID=1762892 RepID=A0ABV7F573_9BURK
MRNQTDYYNQQFNTRAMVPDHPAIFTRWAQDSSRVRRTTLGLFDLAYGEASGERLDFFPATRSGSPLLVYIHGGWWRSFDKSDFSFIAPAYTRAGVNVALLNYTLAPQATLADITLQQLRALAWLYRNAHKYDFDPHRIVVSGHSAGGHLSAMLMTALWPVYGGDLPPDLVRAGVLLSGLYDLEPVRQADYVNLDLKLTPASANVLSPVLMAPSHPAPFITAVGGQESDEFKRQNSLIGQAWQANFAGDIALPDANHMTICDAFATPGDALFEATRKLIADLA